MNREKQRKLVARKMFKKPITKFEEIDLREIDHPRDMTRAYHNTRYMVMVFDDTPVTTGTAIKVMVQKHDNTPMIKHWSEMQRIKNEIFGEETVAIEYYPAESQLIDFHNIYWFWIFPDGLLPIPV